jgi:uncharacterized membrane protein
MNAISKTLIFLGITLILIGIALPFSSRIPWLGRLPGDIYIKKENFSFYFPIATSIIISILLSFILYILGRK